MLATSTFFVLRRRQEFRNVSDIFLFLCEGDAQRDAEAAGRGMLPPLIGADVTSLDARGPQSADGSSRRAAAPSGRAQLRALTLGGAV